MLLTHKVVIPVESIVETNKTFSCLTKQHDKILNLNSH
jgi:hypothetical protein